MPSCNTIGSIVLAVAPPYSRADTNEGRTLCDANSGGREDAVSFSDLLDLLV